MFVALEIFQCLAHPFELAGMGLTADLANQPGSETDVILAQADPGLWGQLDQFARCRLIQPSIR